MTDARIAEEVVRGLYPRGADAPTFSEIHTALRKADFTWSKDHERDHDRRDCQIHLVDYSRPRDKRRAFKNVDLAFARTCTLRRPI